LQILIILSSLCWVSLGASAFFLFKAFFETAKENSTRWHDYDGKWHDYCHSGTINLKLA
jgi:hypothetical protein